MGGATYTYGMLSTKQLKSDPAYQRELDPKKVKQIAEHFNPLKANVIKVSHRDDSYWIFDGQHTARAFVLKNQGKDLMVECKIYEGLSQKDEAELFARQNELQKRVPKNAEMKALYTSGDVEIRELKKTIESVGLIFNFSKNQAKDKIVCCDKCLKIYRKAKSSDFITVLKIIKDSWDGMPESLRAEIVGGMYEFYTAYKDDIDIDLTVNKFSLISPISVIRDGKIYKEFSGDKKYAWVLLNKYNAAQRKNKLDTSKLTN